MAKTEDKEKIIFARYCKAEKKFFEWLESVTDVIYRIDNNTDIFRENYLGQIIVNKMHLRTVRQFIFEDSEKEFHERFEALIKRYRRDFGRRKALPYYFPKFFQNVDYITVTKHEASATKNYSIDEVADTDYVELSGMNLTGTEDQKRAFNKLEEAFEASGYDYIKEEKNGYCAFKVNMKQMLEVNDAEVISVKRPTGHQYHCRIKHVNEKSSTRYQFGFILLESKSEAEVRVSKNPFRRADVIERKKGYIAPPTFPNGEFIFTTNNFYKLS